MQYIKECLQLLYWIYFKPYTLKQHVKSICPEITDPYKDNFFSRSATARANPRLKLYDDRIWWLSALVPIVTIFLFAPLTEGISKLIAGMAVLHFNWWKSSFFLIGWLLALTVVRAIRRRLEEKSASLLDFAVMPLIAFVFFLSNSLLADPFIKEAVESVALGVAGSMAIGVVGSMAVGIMVGIAVGVAPSMAVGGWVGIAVGIAVNIAGSVSLVLRMLHIPFWIPELLWVLLLKLWPRPAATKLPCLPPQFDQIIILPLPFIPSFIAQAYQENQAAARQTIDYLITSTNQQKKAAKAIVTIAAEECSRCQRAKDIAAIKKQLNWISETQQPAGLEACFEISQDVTAAQEGTSLYRQTQQLDKIILKIDRQRNSLATASAREATSFGSVLDSWQRILETARKNLREQAAQSNEIPQVYLAGPALDPNKAGPLFKGRRDLFRQIETLTLSAQHPTLVMHGGRRSGKTSTLNYLPKWLPSDILPLLIDGQSLAATSTLAGFAEDFAEQLTRSAHKVHSLKLPALESIKQSDDPFVRLRRWLDAIEQNIPDKTLLLCLDEFERLDEIVQATASRASLNFLRHLIQHCDNWTLLFTGALSPEELPAYWSDYLINCETLRVTYLNKADCLELIQQPVEDFPDIYPDAVAHAIWDLTGGQPYFTQLLCHELVEQLNRDKAKTVQMDDLQTVLPAVFERGYQVFREFWTTLNNAQQKLLRAVAEKQDPSEEEEAEADRAAPLLLRKEILAQEEKGWSFRVPLIQQWIIKNEEHGKAV